MASATRQIDPIHASDLMREVKRLTLRTRRRVNDLFAGEYHSAFKGRGIEFAEVREYAPGDDVRAIDWNVTARTGKAHIKRFIEERRLTVLLAVDLSASADFGTRQRSKRRLAVEVAATLAAVANRNRDRVGLLAFSDRPELFVPARTGSTHIMRLMRDLIELAPMGRETDIAAALDRLNRLVKRRAVIFVISDFQAPPFDRSLRLLASRHEVACVCIEDPAEDSIPNMGLVELMDAETSRTVVLDTASRLARNQYRSIRAERRSQLARAVAAAGADRIPLRTNQPFIPALARYFRSKEHRR